MAFRPHPSERDLDFLAAALAEPGTDPAETRRRLGQDGAFLSEALDRPEVLGRLRADNQASATISPWLLFALLLREAARDLPAMAAIPEWTGAHEVVPVLDGALAHSALSDPHLLPELERVLTAFTRAHAWRVQMYAGGRLRRLRLSDLEPESLMQMLPYAQGEVAGDLLRRMADAHLFLAGVFPHHVVGRRGEDLGAWERRGQGLYRTAAQHYEEGAPAWASDLEHLAASFHAARRALNFVTERYLAAKRPEWFEPVARGA